MVDRTIKLENMEPPSSQPLCGVWRYVEVLLYVCMDITVLWGIFLTARWHVMKLPQNDEYHACIWPWQCAVTVPGIDFANYVFGMGMTHVFPSNDT